MHIPVLVNEVMEYLRVRPDGVYIDCTAGMAGHTREIARRLTTGMLISNDGDAESLEIARQNTREWADRIRYHHGRFSSLPEALGEAGLGKVDGMLADLGASLDQLKDIQRGFSFLSDGPLDMRFDRTAQTTAGDLVNHMAEKALADLIYQLGEERRARKIARAIVRARPIRSPLHLAGVVERAVPRTGRLHPATQTFMALRLAVNEEQEELDALLRVAPQLTASGGRIVIISFMSLEDRKVKEIFRSLGRENRATLLTKHPIRPAEDEIRNNAASRSAKLRAIEMK
jgi:16S rRNA (cytosine1402-N4)-methyltransferase